LLRKQRYPIEPYHKSLSVALDELRLGAEAIGPCHLAAADQNYFRLISLVVSKEVRTGGL